MFLDHGMLYKPQEIILKKLNYLGVVSKKETSDITGSFSYIY
jgi:hypothetical protein